MKTGIFEKQLIKYKYQGESGLATAQVKDGEVLRADAYSEEDLENAKKWALEQWAKDRKDFYEEAAEMELADRIARNKGEN